jgi:type IV secretion system protein VirB10
MALTEIGDPRLQALFGAKDPRDAGVKPMVRLPRRGLPPVALAVIAVIFGVLLFLILNERRARQNEPSVIVRPDSGASAWQAPPALYVPPAPTPAPEPLSEQEQRVISKPGVVSAPGPMPNPEPSRVAYMPQPVQQMMPPAPQAQPRTSAGAPLVIDSGAVSPDAGSPRTQSSPLGRSSGTVTRMRAGALANRSMTVPQGTLIQAVLETGFDSTQPSFARAVVSRDVRSFDGANVLIPRGSKLIGEIRSEVAQGQKRAGIIWTRLIRPDGMTITMDSPAVDTVGRGGVAASVNTHFWERFGDALLQTTVGIGTALAQRKAAGTVVILPSGATAAATQLVPTNNYVPTLTVPAGKSISVFVAHDLDFTASGTPR